TSRLYCTRQRIRGPELAPSPETRAETMLEAQPPPPPRAMMLADLNVDPPESDGEDHPPTPKPNPAIAAAAPVVAVDSSTRSCNDEGSLAKSMTTTKEPDTVECEGEGMLSSRRKVFCCELTTYDSL
uniref:Uncharacterized protein n=1 Tax=Aegilops tauschii subsp. strangulata TaxID=200361 RepID=A0A453G344_AEGTS